MYLNLVSFNFRSADTDAEERNYFSNHVPLARRLAGLKFYYTGRLMKVQGRDPDRFRAAILGYDSAEAAAAAMTPEATAELIADSRAHLKDLSSVAISGEVVLPFEKRRQGDRCLIMAAEFNFTDGARDLAGAEKHYRETHVELARKLPGLRHYVIGKIAGGDRHRMAVLAFDSLDALRDAYRSPEGLALVRDEQATIADARVRRIDAQVEL